MLIYPCIFISIEVPYLNKIYFNTSSLSLLGNNISLPLGLFGYHLNRKVPTPALIERECDTTFSTFFDT